MSDQSSTSCARPPCPHCGAERDYYAPGWMVCRNIHCELVGQFHGVGVWARPDLTQKAKARSGCVSAPSSPSDTPRTDAAYSGNRELVPLSICRQIERELIAWKADALALGEALRLLYDHQNGPPLYKYEKKWNRAIDLSSAALLIHEALVEGNDQAKPPTT